MVTSLALRLAAAAAAAAAPAYDVAIVDRALGPGGGSVISQANGSSTFLYNFNAAWLPLPGHPGGGLFLRVTDTNLREPVAVSAAAGGTLGSRCAPTTPNSTQSHSMIAFVRATSPDGLRYEHVTPDTLIVPVAPSLDPRATYRPLTDTYYLTYQCNFAAGAQLLRKTFIASTRTPLDVSSWGDIGGPMFAAVRGTEAQDCGTCACRRSPSA